MTACLLKPNNPGVPGYQNMNTPNTEPRATRPRRLAVLTALLVALMGLTIAPGFKCTHEKPDGTKTVVEME